MRPSATLLFLTPLALLLAGATRAPAEVVPWSYNWKPRTGLILSDRPGTGGIFLTNQPHQQAAGAATVIAAYVGAFSSALANAPDHLTNKGYGLILFLTDDASQAKARHARSVLDEESGVQRPRHCGHVLDIMRVNNRGVLIIVLGHQ